MTELSNIQDAGQTQPNRATRALPPWVAILVILLFVGGAGWLAWRQFFAGPNLGEAIDVGSENGRRGFRMVARPPPQPAKEGVTLLGAGLYRIKAGDFSMNLSAKNYDVKVFYDKTDLLPRDQAQMLQAR